MKTELIQGACPHDCPDTCAWQVTVQDGVAIKMQGDPKHPSTAGALCTKVSRYTERTYHPDRVRTPLRRVGPKGSGQFVPVSWEEALSDIARKLGDIAARSPQAILPYSYAGTMGLVQGESMAARFFHALGASRLDRTICASAGAEALVATYGHKVGMHLADFAKARLIIIWGSNSVASNLHFWTLAQQAKRAGAKLVCIDPRRTETADKCHEHLAIQPGTDGALALGLMHELIVQGGLDQAYIDAHTVGWPALRERALAWPPERVAEVCGIEADAVRRLARDYAQTQPAAIRLNYGMQRVHGGGNAVRLVAILPCLTGAWRHEGGGMLLSSSGWFAQVKGSHALERPDLLAGREPRTLNMSLLGEVLNHPGDEAFGPKVEALVVYNSNPAAVAPESGAVLQGLRRTDLFTVVLEHFLTDTADHADYVLPATTQLEHWDVHTSYGHTDVLLNRPAIKPLGDARPNSRIFAALAKHMGMTHPCFDDTDEDLVRQAIPNADLQSQLWSQGWAPVRVPTRPFADGGFPTPDGRCHIDAPGWGVPDHLPNHESALTTPALHARYPLAMISPPARHFLNSTFVNVDSLRRAEGEQVLEMHAQDAADRGLEDGQMVKVWNDRGHMLARLHLNGRARAGVVVGLGVWWHKLAVGGHNVNALTSQALTDLGRAPTFYDCLVQVGTADNTTPIAS